MKFFGLFGRNRLRDTAYDLYAKVVAQARQPEFYVRCGVPDTVDGRFDMIALHAYLLLHHLKQGGAEERQLAQEVFDAMFVDMDRNLREMGTGDLSVGRKVKSLAQAFYGRIQAYDEGLQGEGAELCAALRRNLYRKTEPDAGQLEMMAGYLRQEFRHARSWRFDDLKAGKLAFGPVPAAPQSGDSG